jgi:hypothetical protein
MENLLRPRQASAQGALGALRAGDRTELAEELQSLINVYREIANLIFSPELTSTGSPLRSLLDHCPRKALAAKWAERPRSGSPSPQDTKPH